MSEFCGFVVAAWESGSRLFFSGRLDDGRSFACIEGRGEASILVREDEVARASAALGLGCGEGGSSCGTELDEKPWQDMAGRPLARFLLPPDSLGAFGSGRSRRPK